MNWTHDPMATVSAYIKTTRLSSWLFWDLIITLYTLACHLLNTDMAVNPLPLSTSPLPMPTLISLPIHSRSTDSPILLFMPPCPNSWNALVTCKRGESDPNNPPKSARLNTAKEDLTTNARLRSMMRLNQGLESLANDLGKAGTPFFNLFFFFLHFFMLFYVFLRFFSLLFFSFSFCLFWLINDIYGTGNPPLLKTKR